MVSMESTLFDQLGILTLHGTHDDDQQKQGIAYHGSTQTHSHVYRHPNRCLVGHVGNDIVRGYAVGILNLAVNDDNEVSIGEDGGLQPILKCASSRNSELQAQACRALRNLSVCGHNKEIILSMNGDALLETLTNSNNDRIRSQATRALNNLGGSRNRK